MNKITKKYLKDLLSAYDFSREVGVNGIVENEVYRECNIDELQSLQMIVKNGLIPWLINELWSGYTEVKRPGDCLNAAHFSCAWFRMHGMPAEVVVGNIKSPYGDIYHPTKNTLKREYQSPGKEGVFEGHAWVTLGGDIIIDATFNQYLHKHYNVPVTDIDAFVLTATQLYDDYRITYHPMIVGDDFIEKMCISM